MAGISLRLGLAFLSLAAGTILQNGQPRIVDFPNTKIEPSNSSFATYPANASELSYKGRWDSKHYSWWS